MGGDARPSTPGSEVLYQSHLFHVAKYQVQSLALAVVGRRPQPYGLQTPSGSGDHVGPSAGGGLGGRWMVVWPFSIILKLMANPLVEDYFFPRPRQITPR
ncbi:hypothetical protein C355_03545 [Cryptococcus neoformans Th84]|nr:hypothetical protein C355_03545 [Cryptococcus neoformans var. grubii Th84]